MKKTNSLLLIFALIALFTSCDKDKSGKTEDECKYPLWTNSVDFTVTNNTSKELTASVVGLGYNDGELYVDDVTLEDEFHNFDSSQILAPGESKVISANTYCYYSHADGYTSFRFYLGGENFTYTALGWPSEVEEEGCDLYGIGYDYQGKYFSSLVDSGNTAIDLSGWKVTINSDFSVTFTPFYKIYPSAE